MGDSSTLSASKEKEKSKPQPSSTQIPNLEGGFPTLLVFVILGLAWLVGFASRLFAIVRFESIIHEFDPWLILKFKKFFFKFYRFNYRSTQYMVENGFYNFLNWFDGLFVIYLNENVETVGLKDFS